MIVFQVNDENGNGLSVIQHNVGSVEIFQVAGKEFAPLIIAESVDSNGRIFWATMPEDPKRHRDAQLAGRAISSYLKEQHVLL